MTTQQEQRWAVGFLVIVAVVAALVVMVLSNAFASTGSFNVSSPAGGFQADQSWFLFDGQGKTCHVESWSDNPNRSLHENILITVDSNGTTTHLAVERAMGTSDRGLWDSTDTGEVHLLLKLGSDERSSANYHAEWTCEETPTSTSTSTSSTSTTEEPPASSSTLPPDSTITSPPPGSSSTTSTTFQICAVSDCNVVDPPTTTTTSSIPSSSTTTPEQTTVTTSTEAPRIPSAVPTGEG
jgi:hypothetical protein